MITYDFAIIGAGIAGASIASELSGAGSVLILEVEDQPGYHATGRSAAFWTETYGGPQVQPLTSASRAFLESPPTVFSATGFLKRRGAINIAKAEDRQLADKFVSDFAESAVVMDRWEADKLSQSVPHLKPEWTHGVFEPECFDIDVAALHAAYLADAKKHGAVLQCNARAEEIKWRDGCWAIETPSGRYKAFRLVNAAGAWADNIAEMADIKPIGIQAMRRTMVQIRTDPPSSRGMMLVVALDGNFYFKPEAGGSYWLSPHDETPVSPGDVAPEEIDVAIAIDRFQSVLNVGVEAVTRKWAGLRSFAPDRLPVYGSDPDQPAFFWFAGQGGFGIQTAPAAAKLAKALLLDIEPDSAVKDIKSDIYNPFRFR